MGRPESLRRRARRFRVARGWTQSQMAVYCRVSRETISRLETSKRIRVSDRLRGQIAAQIGQAA